MVPVCQTAKLGFGANVEVPLKTTNIAAAWRHNMGRSHTLDFSWPRFSKLLFTVCKGAIATSITGFFGFTALEDSGRTASTGSSRICNGEQQALQVCNISLPSCL